MSKVVEDFGNMSPNPQTAITVKSVNTEEPATIIVSDLAEAGKGFQETWMQCLGGTGCELFCCILIFGIPSVGSFYIAFFKLRFKDWFSIPAAVFFLVFAAFAISGCYCCCRCLISRKERKRSWNNGDKTETRAGFIHPTERANYPDYEKIEWITGGIRCGEDCAILPRHWPATNRKGSGGPKHWIYNFICFTFLLFLVLGICTWRLTRVFPIEYEQAWNYMFLLLAYVSALFGLLFMIRTLQLVCLHRCGVEDQYEYIPVDREKWEYVVTEIGWGKRGEWIRRQYPEEKKKRELQRAQEKRERNLQRFENRRTFAAWLALAPSENATKEERAAWEALEPKRGHLEQKMMAPQPGQQGFVKSISYLEVDPTEGYHTTTEGNEGNPWTPITGRLAFAQDTETDQTSDQIEGDGTTRL